MALQLCFSNPVRHAAGTAYELTEAPVWMSGRNDCGQLQPARHWTGTWWKFESSSTQYQRCRCMPGCHHQNCMAPPLWTAVDRLGCCVKPSTAEGLSTTIELMLFTGLCILECLLQVFLLSTRAWWVAGLNLIGANHLVYRLLGQHGVALTLDASLKHRDTSWHVLVQAVSRK